MNVCRLPSPQRVKVLICDYRHSRVLPLPTPAAHPKQNNLDIIRGVADDAAFIGSAVFAGKVDGYEFKTDVQVVSIVKKRCNTRTMC